jgi:hypothetical protein
MMHWPPVVPACLLLGYALVLAALRWRAHLEFNQVLAHGR